MLDSDFGSALDASALQDCLTSLGGGPGSKSVRFCTVSFVRLMSSFWHIIYYYTLFVHKIQ